MKAKLIAAGALAAALLIAGVPLGSGSASAAITPTKTRVMLAGDSITEGLDGDYTWRYRLAMELKRQGTSDLVDLVGPKTNPKGGYGHYLGGRAWDLNHDATGGTTLSYQLNNIGSEVATYKPDILVSYLGTNDFLAVPRAAENAGKTPEELMPQYEAKITEVLDNWKTYLNQVRAAKPSVKIVLGELITPRVPESIRNSYNDQLRRLSETSWFALGSPIAVAQLDSPLWTSSRYLYDTIHPAPTGETKLAQLFATAIDDLDGDLFPATIAIERSFVAWNPPLKAKIAVVGRRITMDWAYTATYNRITKMRVKIGTVSTGTARVTAFTPTTSFRTAALKPGTYRIRLQANRTYMNSTWSPVYVVKVK